VLFVDAALPAPPRTRPLLVAGCAAAIVVILVLVIGPQQDLRFLGYSGPAPDPHSVESPPGAVGPVADDKGAGAGKQARSDQPPAAPELVTTTIDSGPALEEFARTMVPGKDYRLILADDLHLGGGGPNAIMVEDGAGVVLRGHSVTLEAVPGRQATIWSRFVARAPRWGGLVIDAEVVNLSGLRVVADASETDPVDAAAGVWLRNTRNVSVARCEFLQGYCLRGSRFSSLAVQPATAPAGNGAQPHVTLEKCCFLGAKAVRRADVPTMGSDGWLKDVVAGGQIAVAILGGASVRASDCAFGPHAALFRFEGKRTSSELAVDDCTALAGDEWTLAYLGEDTTANVRTNSCFFGRLEAAPDAGGMMMPSERKPTACLIRSARNADAKDYRGTSNRYLNLDAVRLRANDDAATAADSFTAQLAAPAEADEKVLGADSRPWKADVLTLLQGSLTPADLLAAFRLDPVRVADLRCGKDSSAVVGIHQSLWGPEWDAAELTPIGGSPAVAVKVVDPKQTTDAARGLYRSLAAALEDAKSGDVIAIRHSGELTISPVKLVKNGVSLTIRADEGSHPVLVLDQDAPEAQAALFRVHTGQLTLERLEFRLLPTRAGFKSQAVALLYGEGSVQLTRCAVTLDGRQAAAPLAAVLLADADEAMMQPGGAGVPRVGFDTCFVRGDGDLVSARSNRLFELEVKDSLVALTGSLLNVDAAAKDAPAAPAGKEIPVRLTQTTAFLGGHLARLRAANLSSLVPVHCVPIRSLLVSAGDKKALVHVEAGPKDLTTASGRLLWNGESNNYANFSPMLDQQPGENEMAAAALTQTDLKEKDDQSTFSDVKFAGPLWTDGDVAAADVLPRAFALKSGPRGVGVRKTLPVPGES
jgi:hypothetical protein